MDNSKTGFAASFSYRNDKHRKRLLHHLLPGISLGWLLFAFLPINVQASVLVHEKFEGELLPATWQFDFDGEWTIIDGQLAQRSIQTTEPVMAVTGDPINWTDYTAEVRLRFIRFGSEDPSAGLIVRHSQIIPGGDCLAVQVVSREGRWYLDVSRPDHAGLSWLLPESIGALNWITLKVVIEGYQLQVWLDDKDYPVGRLGTKGAPLPVNGNIGLISANAHVRFDDLKVFQIEGSTDRGEPATIFLLGLGLVGFLFGSKIGGRIKV